MNSLFSRRQALKRLGAGLGYCAVGPAVRLMATPSAGGLDLSRWLGAVRPEGIFQDPAWCIWCGSMIPGDDGRFHLFYSRWPRQLGFAAWVTHSEIAHAVAERPAGPYRHVQVVLGRRGPDHWDGSCTHNPTVIRANGRFYLYYMGNYGDEVVREPLNWVHRNHQRIGVAVADSPEGPWTRFDRPVIDVSSEADAPDALMTSNPAACLRPDGSVLLVYKGVGKREALPFGGPVVHLVATSSDPLGPFRKRLEPIFTRPGVHFAAEDPFIWRDGDGYRAIVKDNDGLFTGHGYSLALFDSPDGFAWRPAAHPFVANPGSIALPEGLGRLRFLERPQLYLEGGVPRILFCAAAIEGAPASAFNLAIPLQAPI